MKPIRRGPDSCQVSECRIGRHLNAVTLENELMAVTVLPEKGADIYAMRYKPKDMDVLWKTPWEVKELGTGGPTTADSATVWLEHYAGGWQEILPNAGDACIYKGVELSFHGEASLLPWSYEVLEHTRQRVTVRFSVTLYRSPFTLVRTMSLEENKPVLVLTERVVNEAAEDMDFMWGHHPAFGAPFLSEACVINTGANTIEADDRYAPPSNLLTPGEEWGWPDAVDTEGNPINMSRVPPPHNHVSCLAYLKDFDEGWYAITNTQFGFGIGLVWPKEIFPYAYFWEEAHASLGFPFYGRAYTVAIEPFSSIPGQGLENVMKKTGTHLRLQPGGEIEMEMRAVFFESPTGVRQIGPDGSVKVS